MVSIIKILPFLLALNAFALGDTKIGGTINASESVAKNILITDTILIQAYSMNDDFSKSRAMAEFKIMRPKFPQGYLLGPKNMLEAGKPFTGPFKLKISTIGNSKRFWTFAPKGGIQNGDHDYNLTLE